MIQTNIQVGSVSNLLYDLLTSTKAKTYDRKNSINLHEAQDIYKQSSGLDNISEFDMKRFREIMLGAR